MIRTLINPRQTSISLGPQRKLSQYFSCSNVYNDIVLDQLSYNCNHRNVMDTIDTTVKITPCSCCIIVGAALKTVGSKSKQRSLSSSTENAWSSQKASPDP